MSVVSRAEVEHASWVDLKRMCAELGLNPKGRSEVVRLRVLDHLRRATRREAWRAGSGHQAPLLARLGFPESAARLWESTIRLDAPAPWVGMGSARLGSGDLEEAAKAFDRAVQMADAVAHLHKAEALAAGGDFQGAVRACEAYLAMRPGDLRGLGMKAAFLARGGWSEAAAEELRSALESHPQAREVWRGLGIQLLKAGRHAPAAEAFHEAVRADPKDVDAWVNRGTALLLAGRARDAVGAFREALEIDPGRADALNNLGVAYLKADETKSATVNLERAAKHLETPQILLNVAHVREAAHRKEDAVAAYAQALRLRPRDAEAIAGKRRLAPRKAAKKPRAPHPRSAPVRKRRKRAPPVRGRSRKRARTRARRRPKVRRKARARRR